MFLSVDDEGICFIEAYKYQNYQIIINVLFRRLKLIRTLKVLHIFNPSLIGFVICSEDKYPKTYFLKTNVLVVVFKK